MGDVFDVFRVAKLKSWCAISGTDAHNSRSRPPANADPARSHLNRVVLGDPGRALVDAVRDKIGDQKVRRNAVLAVELVISASPSFFRPSHPERAGAVDAGRLDAWLAAKLRWLQKKYGDRLVRVDLHCDETTPHLHVLLVPLDDRRRLNCRALFGGTRQTLSRLQDESAQAVEHLGIRRGIRDARARHSTISEYYAYVSQPAETLPAVVTPKPPELTKPGFLATKADRAAWAKNQRQLEQHHSEVEARTAAALRLVAKSQAKAQEVDLLKKQVKALKVENSTLAAQISTLKEQANRLRGLPLADVLQTLYGAKESTDSRPSYASRKFDLAGAKIGITEDKWVDNRSGKGGRGAINLVMHLEQLPDNSEGFRKAVALLADAFGAGAIPEAARHGAEQARAVAEAARKAPPPLPASEPHTWQRVRDYLVSIRKLPASLIDSLHAKGIVYSDQRANAVFVREGGGAFVRASREGTGSQQDFRRTVGRWEQGCGAFMLSGNREIYVTEAPIDALTLKALHPHATVIASGGNAPLERIKRIIDGALNIFLAHDADRAGDAQAERIRQAYPQATRLPPPEPCKDWNDYLIRSHRQVDKSGTGKQCTTVALLQARRIGTGKNTVALPGLG